jgi:hypothetical protein
MPLTLVPLCAVPKPKVATKTNETTTKVIRIRLNGDLRIYFILL